jgi:putative colanic acid biosynthesis acetyltransferase WcaF
VAPRDDIGAGVPLNTSAGPIQVGFFDRREKARRLAWNLVQATIFRWSFKRADRWRAFLLRRFGARIGRRPLIRRTVHVEVPWNLILGDDVKLGDEVIVYNLGPITIGDRSRVSQYAHLCGGSHDHTRSDFPLHRVPIRIGADVWVAADVYVAPGVVIGDGTVVGARSSVYRDLPPWQICIGSPARAVKPRVLRRVERGAGS